MFSALFMALAALACVGFSVSAYAAEPIAVESRIDAVTVFPSGAEVVRVGQVKLAEGAGTLVFRNLPAEAVAESIRVDGKSAGPLQIGAVDVRRLFVPQHSGQDVETERRRLEKEIEALEDQRRLAEARVTAADTQRTLIGNLTNLPNRPPPTAAAGAAPPSENWAEIIRLIETSLADVAKARGAAESQVRELARQIDDLRGKLAALAPSQEERTEVRVAVVAGAVLEADLAVRYQMPDASWQPGYDARLSTGSKTEEPSLVIARRATITQRSGEPWENVTIELSTTRPSAGTAAPELRPMSVDYPAPPPPPPAPMAESRGGSAFGRMADKAMPQMDAPAEMAAAAPRVRRAAKRMEATVDVSAFQATFKVPGRATVMNTGEEKSVDLIQDKLSPKLIARAVPKRDAKAFLYAKFDVPRGSPMLPGRIALFRDGTFVGNGRLPQLAGGEDHELGFGADDLVRVRHDVVKEMRGETGIISSTKTDDRNYRLSVKNLHARAIDVAVLDQLPVSKNQEIRVDLVAKPQPTHRDVDNKAGVLRWETTLAPDAEQVIEFGYRVSWPSGKSIEYQGR